MNKTEAYTALFALLFAVANIFLIIFKVSGDVITIFSFALSIAVLYFAWRELQVLEVISQIKQVIMLHIFDKRLDKALKESVDAIQSAKGFEDAGKKRKDK